MPNEKQPVLDLGQEWVPKADCVLEAPLPHHAIGAGRGRQKASATGQAPPRHQLPPQPVVVIVRREVPSQQVPVEAQTSSWGIEHEKMHVNSMFWGQEENRVVASSGLAVPQLMCTCC